MDQELIDKLRPQLEKTLEYLKSELAALQVGRASPRLIEDLKVDCYGEQMALKQLAAIQVPEPRLIIIQPWDKGIIKKIEEAIVQAQLGLTPITEEGMIRIKVPALSQEQRQKIIAVLQEKAEEGRISIRRQREETWRTIQQLEREGKISEDDKYRAKDKLQKLVDEYNDQIKEMVEQKKQSLVS